ncbi:hypothetical protein [Gulosibacter molinativorax]|uniref:DNA-binding protein n=1 Tax=Gulosibacter molinativorax TaxID=256821 RepID=A0ABT7C5R8_9MICO|nr:hypothetical protein [Gulosibacter molinativorax]MDJ1370152.1 hypothetical protein [Gulosibacter molinativorax]QUY61563.1 Hypotetical protein [Gulosibacter molinativorax]
MADTETPSPDELRRRLIEALIAYERAETELEQLTAARDARELADALEEGVISEARAARVSWAKIGAVYGLTKQGAQQRFSAKTGPSAEPDIADS